MLACLILLVIDNILFGWYLELNCLFIVDPPAVGAGALLVSILETVEAELTYLISARTGLEILVCKIKFFDAEGTEETP